MGLDMYLYRVPRYGDVTPRQIMDMEHYFDWKEHKEKPGSAAKKCSLKAWCGVDFKTLPQKRIRNFYQQHYTPKCYYWDTEKRYEHNMIFEHVGYWRKVNAVHNWFVENAQHGVDDCGYYEVPEYLLEELLNLCRDIKASVSYVNGNKVVDQLVASEYLPTRSGFFFGDTSYDEWYLKGIDDTIEILSEVLTSTDFGTQMIIYSSSW